jgi:hypothetical protein
MNYEGFVSGIDVVATPGQSTRTLAFISQGSKTAGEIQVSTTNDALLTALVLASGHKKRVEVTYSEKAGQKTLTRVRLLDR